MRIPFPILKDTRIITVDNNNASNQTSEQKKRLIRNAFAEAIMFKTSPTETSYHGKDPNKSTGIFYNKFGITNSYLQITHRGVFDLLDDPNPYVKLDGLPCVADACETFLRNTRDNLSWTWRDSRRKPPSTDTCHGRSHLSVIEMNPNRNNSYTAAQILHTASFDEQTPPTIPPHIRETMRHHGQQVDTCNRLIHQVVEVMCKQPIVTLCKITPKHMTEIENKLMSYLDSGTDRAMLHLYYIRNMDEYILTSTLLPKDTPFMISRGSSCGSLISATGSNKNRLHKQTALRRSCETYYDYALTKTV
uniref:ORF48 n=1 Tax=Malaco herpesvirus 4 TaxID=3031800 RepID=A0AA48SFG0_9VIRU|nr:TPA_asm: ORF48 [Malaco herpesvirus 4]